MISEQGGPPVAQPDLSRCHVTEGNGPAVSCDCVVLPSVIAPTAATIQVNECVDLIYHPVGGTSKLV